MSDSDKGSASAAPSGSAAFTERELQMLGWAMQSLKTGPPDIDYEKLAGFAGMSNPRSASNAWAKIKTKLIVPAPNADGTTPAPTPKKAAPRKKAAPKECEEGETPKKTPRKRAPKKQDVDGADASPKKKGRPAKKDESIKTENDDSETAKSAGTPAPVKPEPEVTEENVEDEV